MEEKIKIVLDGQKGEDSITPSARYRRAASTGASTDALSEKDNYMKLPRSFAIAFSIALASASIAAAEDNLAQQLSNPLAAIISVPFQLNFDDGLGATGDGTRTILNFQPVVPFSLENGANIITRTIIPYVWQEDVVPGTSQEGFGDISLSVWYSRTTEGGLTWGVGPTVLIPTGSTVSGETWGLGVTGIALQVSGPWTYGALASQTWSLEDNPTTEINRTFLQPFVAFDAGDGWTLSANLESTYDWVTEEWTGPVNFAVSKLTIVGKVPVSWQLGAGYWADSPAGGPEDWRLRLGATIVLPQ